VESVLKALDEQSPTAIKSLPQAEADKPIWHLEGVEVHRFGGLQHHLGPDGEDPAPLVLELDKDITLISGFNGAGKTALLSAIIWCLTGKALRSQHMPHEVHEPMAVEWSTDTDGMQETDSPQEIAVPPIVPIPSADNLARLGDLPKNDTRVSLTFRRPDTGKTSRVTRKLEVVKGKFRTVVEGRDGLGISALAIEAGTLMPGVAAHMRFDERSSLAQAVSQLTGLRPLEDLGHRTKRLVDRLRTVEKRRTEKARDNKTADFKAALQRLREGWSEHPDLAQVPEILLPGETQEVEPGTNSCDDGGGQQGQTDCTSSIAAAKERLNKFQCGMSVAMEAILGCRIELTKRQEVDTISRKLDHAADRLKKSALSELPSIRLLLNLGKITDVEADAALTAIREIIDRARSLSERLAQERQAARWRLYSRVSAWHKDRHPDQHISNCPVCGTDLDEVPPDALLELSVKEALNKCREADSDIAKTKVEWERDEAAAFLNGLAESLRRFADNPPRDTLLGICRKGYVEELLVHEAFTGWLEPLRNGGQVLWNIASGEHPLPEPSKVEDSALPDLFSFGKLQKRLNAVAYTLMLREHRKRSFEVLQALTARYIGKAKSVGKSTGVGESDAAEYGFKPDEQPLREQIEAIRSAVQNANPVIYLARQLGDLERLNREWKFEENRIELLVRAADAVEPYLKFPDLVHERVTGMIETLSDNTEAWLGKIYRSHYSGGPSYGGIEPTEDSGFGLRAELLDMRVPAYQVMNASLLRACVWAFLFALWEHICKRTGGLSCMLLDDPQTHFDPNNRENLAAAISLMPDHGMRPLITSNEMHFIASIQGKLRSRTTNRPTCTALRLDPVSSAKLTATLSPAPEEIKEKGDQWRNDENHVLKAQDFVKCVRVDIENRLWNLLAADQLIMHKPTLGDLLDRIRHARKQGERPFDEQPFERLVTHMALRDGEPFYEIINRAHHRPMEITPGDAVEVNKAYTVVHRILRSCNASYDRFMGRLMNEDRDLILGDGPPAPAAVTLPSRKLPVLGRLAARGSADILAIGDDHEQLALDSLGSVAMYALRGPTLGSLALAGQVVMVSLDRKPDEGEPVIALYKDRVYARCLYRDKVNFSWIVLVADRSGTERVPPPLIVPTSATRAMPIVGILYDSQMPSGLGEAVAVSSSKVLSRKLVVAHVSEDSAYPVVRDGDMVMLEEIDDISPATMSTLEGRIVALTLRDGHESFGYLKRLGHENRDGTRIYENIGLNGQTLCIPSSSEDANHIALGSDLITRT